MPLHIAAPVVIPAEGQPPKIIEEFVGRVNGGEERISIARMYSPKGWTEPAQKPEFDEYTLVFKGVLQVESDEGTLEVSAGQAVLCRAGERVRYSSPGEDGAEYMAVCIPAFSPNTVHRQTESEQ